MGFTASECAPARRADGDVIARAIELHCSARDRGAAPRGRALPSTGDAATSPAPAPAGPPRIDRAGARAVRRPRGAPLVTCRRPRGAARARRSRARARGVDARVDLARFRRRRERAGATRDARTSAAGKNVEAAARPRGCVMVDRRPLPICAIGAQQHTFAARMASSSTLAARAARARTGARPAVLVLRR